MAIDISGQYFGRYSGNTTQQSGDLIVNLDRRSQDFSGSLTIIEEAHHDLPHTVFYVSLHVKDDDTTINGHADISSAYVDVGGIFRRIDLNEFAEKYPAASIPKQIFINGNYNDDYISLAFVTSDKTTGSATVQRRAPNELSKMEPKTINWETFKTTFAKDYQRGFIFRGQSDNRPLRTSFHRFGRFDLLRFAIEDAHQLEDNITLAIDQPLDMKDPRNFLALLGIAQHHGYPTPLLDWTESPYIAAYFACRDSVNRSSNKNPTIFCFNRNAWASKNPHAEDITQPSRNITIVNPPPIKNPRVIPQQSVLMYCNVDDVENFVKEKENKQNQVFLTAFKLEDNPAYILGDLRRMGVYAGSLFPGLDGACRGVYEESIEY